MVKSFNFSIEYVLYEMSYVNMIMYGSVLPSYNGKSKTTNNNQEIIDANDPRNIDKINQFGED